MDGKTQSSIKIEHLEDDVEYPDDYSYAQETLTKGHIFDKIDSGIPQVVTTEQPEMYLDYAEIISQSPQSYPSITTHKHSEMEMFHATDMKLVKQELSDGLCTKKPYLSESFQFHNMEIEVNHTQLCRGPLDLTVDSVCSSHTTIQTPYMLDVGGPSDNAENKKQKVDTPQEQQVSGATVAKGDQLMRHACMRTQTEEIFYNCDDCVTSFTQEGQGHMRTNTGLRHKCDHCGASFSQVCNLKSHKRIHTGEKPYKCDICSASFAQHKYLKDHKRTHTGEKPYKCDICAACFSQMSNLKGHKRRHAGERPYKCDDCGVSFTETGHLKCHKRTHTGEKPYNCEVCSASFGRQNNLTAHKRRHTGAKPYKCDDCGTSFSEAGHLKYHKRTHTGERPFKCDVCSAAFTRHNNLMNHKKRHIGEKPY